MFYGHVHSVIGILVVFCSKTFLYCQAIISLQATDLVILDAMKSGVVLFTVLNSGFQPFLVVGSQFSELKKLRDPSP